jgi:hypothetical protein
VDDDEDFASPVPRAAGASSHMMFNPLAGGAAPTTALAADGALVMDFSDLDGDDT